MPDNRIPDGASLFQGYYQVLREMAEGRETRVTAALPEWGGPQAAGRLQEITTGRARGVIETPPLPNGRPSGLAVKIWDLATTKALVLLDREGIALRPGDRVPLEKYPNLDKLYRKRHAIAHSILENQASNAYYFLKIIVTGDDFSSDAFSKWLDGFRDDLVHAPAFLPGPAAATAFPIAMPKEPPIDITAADREHRYFSELLQEQARRMALYRAELEGRSLEAGPDPRSYYADLVWLSERSEAIASALSRGLPTIFYGSLDWTQDYPKNPTRGEIGPLQSDPASSSLLYLSSTAENGLQLVGLGSENPIKLDLTWRDLSDPATVTRSVAQHLKGYVSGEFRQHLPHKRPPTVRGMPSFGQMKLKSLYDLNNRTLSVANALMAGAGLDLAQIHRWVDSFPTDNEAPPREPEFIFWGLNPIATYIRNNRIELPANGEAGFVPGHLAKAFPAQKRRIPDNPPVWNANPRPGRFARSMHRAIGFRK